RYAALRTRPARQSAGPGRIVGFAPWPLLADGKRRRPPAAPARSGRPPVVRPALAPLAGLPLTADGGPESRDRARPSAWRAGRGPGRPRADRLRPARDRDRACSTEQSRDHAVRPQDPVS